MARISNDDKIIAANPGLSAHEYRLLGVSEKKVQEISAKEETEGKKQRVNPNVVKDEPTKPEVPPAKAQPVVTKDVIHRATPMAKIFVPETQSEMATLVDLTTGARNQMARKYAEKLGRKNPKKFRVE